MPGDASKAANPLTAETRSTPPQRSQQAALHLFWGRTAFTGGILWGLANIVYSPAAALTSIQGSSWPEVFLSAAGGFLALACSAGAFYRRKPASIALLAGGIMLLFFAVAAQVSGRLAAHGMVNLAILFLAGGVSAALGAYGLRAEAKGWPALR